MMWRCSFPASSPRLVPVRGAFPSASSHKRRIMQQSAPQQPPRRSGGNSCCYYRCYAFKAPPPSAASSSLRLAQRSFMSTQPLDSPAPDYETQMMLILGKPGGGKGTISGKILKDFPIFQHLSSGDILRQHVMEQTPLGLQAKTYMDKGKLVPDEVMIDLVMAEATPALEDGKALLLDGFPRTLKQAIALEKVTHIGSVVNLDIPTDTIVDRIADRWIHPGSGRVYSYSYKPPAVHGKDDVTGEDLIQREDDKPESVRRRLAAYDKVTKPLVDWYAKKGVLKTFRGTMSDVIYPQVKAWLESKGY